MFIVFKNVVFYTNRAGYQGSKEYPSFIVRLSFVIGSFKLRNSWEVARVRMEIK